MTTERHPSVPDSGGHPTNHRRKAIPATCALDRGPVEHVNLMVSKRDGTIVLDPQVTGSCVISLDEEGARTLCDLLTVWLR
ncbi:MAG: hypothetical protein WCF33_02155 [Pseudonocardiaceae bacterium]